MKDLEFSCNSFSLDDHRVLGHWVCIFVNRKFRGMVKDLQLEIYGERRHVAVSVSAHEITMFRRQRKALKFDDISINDVHLGLGIEKYAAPEAIQEVLMVPIEVAEEIHGVWQGLVTGFYDNGRVPVMKYNVN